jgi:hypothetical protein
VASALRRAACTYSNSTSGVTPAERVASGGPARSLGTQEKASPLSIMIQHITIILEPGSVEPIRVLHQKWRV